MSYRAVVPHVRTRRSWHHRPRRRSFLAWLGGWHK